MPAPLSKGFLEAQKTLETYRIKGQLEAQPHCNGFWLFDYWRDSWNKQWEVTTIVDGEGLTEHEALTLGAYIHPHYRKSD